MRGPQLATLLFFVQRLPRPVIAEQRGCLLCCSGMRTCHGKCLVREVLIWLLWALLTGVQQHTHGLFDPRMLKLV